MTSSVAQVAAAMDASYWGSSPMRIRDISLRELVGRHRWCPSPSRPSLRAVMARHATAGPMRIRFVHWNAYLLDIVVTAKRLVKVRAGEIGPALAPDYDLVSLCEVWSTDSVRAILSGWGSVVPTHASGRSGDLTNGLGSGLLVVSPGQALEYVAEHSFEAEGAVWDADKWAEKGVMLTRVPLAKGKIELFSTHLFFGDGSGEEERTKVRLKELAEFVQFFKSQHDPRNVALLAGDFNIEAGSDGYDRMIALLASISLPGGGTTGFKDFWLHGVGDAAADRLAGTNREGDAADPKREKDFSAVCHFGFPAGSAASGPTRDFFCDDRSFSSRGRVDFVFVEAPQPTHLFDLDLSRLRRRTFGRADAVALVQPVENDREYYLSDHLALDVLLIATPRD